MATEVVTQTQTSIEYNVDSQNGSTLYATRAL